MDFEGATSRLRRTFAYPVDNAIASSRNDDDNDDGPALDEQEQEDLIRSLAQQNAERNAQFRLLLLALPALATAPYFLLLSEQLISQPGRGETESERRRAAVDIWIVLLALSSLASTAWTLWSLQPGVTGIQELDEWMAATSSSPTISHSMRRGLLSAPQHRSPLAQYLPFLQLVLCNVLCLTGFLLSWRSRNWGHFMLAVLPCAVYGVVLGAKMLMGSTDPERELSALRYDYKGA